MQSQNQVMFTIATLALCACAAGMDAIVSNNREHATKNTSEALAATCDGYDWGGYGETMGYMNDTNRWTTSGNESEVGPRTHVRADRGAHSVSQHALAITMDVATFVFVTCYLEPLTSILNAVAGWFSDADTTLCESCLRKSDATVYEELPPRANKRQLQQDMDWSKRRVQRNGQPFSDVEPGRLE
jgi:hypothetical protein